MCKGIIARSLLLSGVDLVTDDLKTSSSKEQRPVKSGNADDAAFNEKCFVSNNVPGCGMAVAQAQHALREMVDTLKKNDIKVSYAITLLLADCI